MPRLPFPHAAPLQIEEQERIKDVQAAVLPFDRIETGDMYPDDFLDVLDGIHDIQGMSINVVRPIRSGFKRITSSERCGNVRMMAFRPLKSSVLIVRAMYFCTSFSMYKKDPTLDSSLVILPGIDSTLNLCHMTICSLIY